MVSFGRYQLLEELGRGGMSEVFLARVGEGPLAKLLAIKRLLPDWSENARLVQRLAAEARLTVWLTHPNIVQVFDFGKVGESYYIAMEYVDGCDLRSVIQPKNRSPIQLPVEVALDLGYRIVDALRYAHQCTDSDGRPLGIIHRDVSPHNVLISRDGHPKLADFGLARAVFASEHHTRPGAVLGKFSYMAPEQARGRDYDARVDVYSAGAVLYQMLTGSKPFPERRSSKDAVRHDVPPPPSLQRPSISPSVDALVLRSLAPQPEDRFPDAAQMAEALLVELTAVGGPPKPHQISTLVEEALRLRRPPAHEDRASLHDWVRGEDSLIGQEVTRVQRHLEVGTGTEPAALPTAASPALPPTASTAALGEGLRAVSSAPAAASALGIVETIGAMPRGMRLWVVSGLGLSAALVVFGLGLLVGRRSAQAPPPRCPAPAAAPALRPCPTARPAPSGTARASALAAASQPATEEGGESPSSLPATKAATRRRRGTGTARPVAVEDPDLYDMEDEDEREPANPPPGGRAPRPRPKGVAKPTDLSAVATLLREAQQRYLEGDHAKAIRAARRALEKIPEHAGAWQIVGASGCYLKQRALVQQALDHLDLARRQLVRSICRRTTVLLD